MNRSGTAQPEFPASPGEPRRGALTLIVIIAGSILAGCVHDGDRATPAGEERMIMDQLDRAGRCVGMHPAFPQAFAFLNRADLATLPPGRYEIDGQRLFCSISNGPGRSRQEADLEAHRKYIDIQYVIAGTEVMGWKPTAECRISKTAYNPAEDIEFFSDEPATWTEVPAGSFVIFFPRDAHAPLVGEAPIHKAVLKIAVE